MDTRHPVSHYYGGRLKPWWRQVQRSEERQTAEDEAAEDEEDDQ